MTSNLAVYYIYIVF